MADKAPAPGIIAAVCWAEMDGNPGLLVKAEGSVNLGIATIVMCQSIVNLPSDFDQATRDAAAALILRLTSGEGFPQSQPTIVLRGERGQG